MKQNQDSLINLSNVTLDREIENTLALGICHLKSKFDQINARWRWNYFMEVFETKIDPTFYLCLTVNL